LPYLPKAPPSGFGYPLGGVSLSALESLFQLPTLLGFALQSLSPTSWPVNGFPPTTRSCAFPPNPSAWRRRSSGVRSRSQPCIPPSAHDSGPSGATALLSLRTSRVIVRRAFEEAPSFFIPLSPLRSRPPKKPGTRTPGASSRRPGVSLLAKGADPSGVPDRQHLPPLRNVSRARPIFSARSSRNPHGPRKSPLSARPHSSCGFVAGGFLILWRAWGFFAFWVYKFPN
jgi:hypothetical protein